LVSNVEDRKRTRRTERTERGQAEDMAATRRTSRRTREDKEDKGRTRSLYKADSNAASQYPCDGAKVNISKKKE